MTAKERNEKAQSAVQSRRRAQLLSDLQKKKKKPAFGIGFDLGTGFISVSVFDGTKTRHVKTSTGEKQILAAYYEDTAGNEYFGTDALLHANDDSDGIALHIKRNITDNPDEKRYCRGKKSAIDVTAKVISHATELLLSQMPELKDFEQFGGTRSAEELVIYFTTPADWTIQQQAAYRKAAKLAGHEEFDGFVAEPIAACRHLLDVPGVVLFDGCNAHVNDLGAGTMDQTFQEYRQGTWNQLCGATGRGYLGGHDFTAAIAKEIAEQLRYSFEGVFTREHGLNLSAAKPRHRASLLAIWLAAEEIKCKVCVTQSRVSVAVNLPKGRKVYSLDQARALELWSELRDEFKEAVASGLSETRHTFKDVDLFLLVGGSSQVPGLRASYAEAVGRKESDIIVCTDSVTLISDGAAQQGFFQDSCDQAFESGLAVALPDETGTVVNVPLIERGQVIKADGFFSEFTGFQLVTRGGDQTLSVKPAAIRPGVRVDLSSGTETVLADSEIIPLKPVKEIIEGWPGGVHRVTLGAAVGRDRIARLVVRPTDPALRRVEPLVFPLEMMEHTQSEISEQTKNWLVSILLDTSASMHGDKKYQAQVGCTQFIDSALGHGWELGLVQFPKDGDVDATVLVPIGQDRDALVTKVNALTTGWGTPIDAAFDKAREMLAGHDNAVAVAFTDGHPACIKSAIQAANRLKAAGVRVITVGIGPDVLVDLLKELASSPEDYFDAYSPEDIPARFADIEAVLRRDRFQDSGQFYGDNDLDDGVPGGDGSAHVVNGPENDEIENEVDVESARPSEGDTHVVFVEPSTPDEGENWDDFESRDPEAA